MPSEYHALFPPHPCLIQDPSTPRDRRYCTVANLNRDGSPEIIFATYGNPDVTDSGYLVILGADGRLLHDITLRNLGRDGNGNGAPTAPAIYDLNGGGPLRMGKLNSNDL